MIKIENVDVFGWEAAIRGMRNPMNSWDMSDSKWVWFKNEEGNEEDGYSIGENDLKLMCSLSKAGNDHAKFLRMINVTCDIVAPRYWWIEFDTYKVGTVCNSCSTMHKITEKEFTLDDFSCEHLNDVWEEDEKNIIYYNSEYGNTPFEVLEFMVDALNKYRTSYLKTKNKRYWWMIIQLLPQSYNQRRTVQLNYQVLKSMYHARKNHKLDEWRAFCGWCESLSYFKEICVAAED